MSKEKTLSVDPKKKRLQTQILVIAIVVAAFVVCHFITGGRLLAPNNLRTILTQVTYPMIVALGMMFIFTGPMIPIVQPVRSCVQQNLLSSVLYRN